MANFNNLGQVLRLNIFKSQGRRCQRYVAMSSERCPGFPSDWVKRGFVYMHPNDRRIYPKEFSTVDPQTFEIPTPEPGDCITNWGFANPRTNKNGGPVDWGENMNMYNMYPSPYEQYTAVLAKRKQQAVSSPETQEACKTILRIKSKLFAQLTCVCSHYLKLLVFF